MFIKNALKSGLSGPFLFTCCVLGVLPIHAQAETLSQAVTQTIAMHPQVEGALAVLQGAQQSKKEQASAYFPELNINAKGGRIYGDNSTSRGLSVTRGAGYSNYGEGSITARQLLFDGFETQHRVSAAKAEVEASELNIEDVRESLAYRTVQTYIELLRIKNGLALLKNQGKTVEDYLSRINSMVEDGAADDSELQQAKDISIILDNYIADYEGQYAALQSSYQELTGHLPQESLEKPSVDAALIPETIEEAIAAAKEQHPLLKALRYRAQAAKQNMKAEQSGYIPTFDAELSALKSDKEDILGGEVEDARALLRMNWDFEVGGAQKARIQQRNFEYKEVMAQVSENERKIESTIRQAYAELETAKRQYKNHAARNELNKKLLATYDEQFKGALISVLQLMQADNQVLLTSLESVNAQSRVLLAQYGILTAMGNLQSALQIRVAEAQLPKEQRPKDK